MAIVTSVTADYINTQLSLKANAADLTTAQATINTALALKANATDLTSGLATKANATDLTSGLALKADASSTFLKTNNLSDLPNIATARTNLNVAQRIFYDVRDYGAVGNGTTDDTTAIQAALNAAPAGATVYLPATHLVSAPIKIPPQIRLVGNNGSHLDQALKPTLVVSAAFTGAAVILIVDQTTGSYATVSNEQHVYNLSMDFSAVPGAHVIDGIQVQGFVSGGVLDNIGINAATGYGVNFVSNASGVASSWRAFRVSVTYANATYGINATIDDSTWIDCEVKNCGSNGWQVGNAINSTFIACRADNNASNGYYFDSGDGTTGYVGGPIFVGCSTNRNGQNGVYIPVAANGNTPITFDGCRFQRDGSSSTSAGYAGININGSTQPILLNGCQVSPGTNADGTGNNTPQYGLNAASASVYIQGGVYHALNEGIHDGGSNVRLSRGVSVFERTGSVSAPVDTLRGIQTTGGNNGSLDVPGNLAGVIPPSGHGAIAWVYDPSAGNISGVLNSGVMFLSTMYVAKKATAVKLWWDIQTVATTVTSGKNFIGIYDQNGNLLQSVGIDARMTTTGLFQETISVAVSPGNYRVAWLMNASTCAAVTRRNGVVDASLANFGLTASGSRYATYGSGLIALPATLTLANLIPSNLPYWAAIG